MKAAQSEHRQYTALSATKGMRWYALARRLPSSRRAGAGCRCAPWTLARRPAETIERGMLQAHCSIARRWSQPTLAESAAALPGPPRRPDARASFSFPRTHARLQEKRTPIHLCSTGLSNRVHSTKRPRKLSRRSSAPAGRRAPHPAARGCDELGEAKSGITPVRTAPHNRSRSHTPHSAMTKWRSRARWISGSGRRIDETTSKPPFDL